MLIVLHQMGSHGPAYARRSPPDRKPFAPECTTNVLRECDAQALVNAYDDSIAYTDHVLALAAGWVGRQAAAHDATLLYVSNHQQESSARAACTCTACPTRWHRASRPACR